MHTLHTVQFGPDTVGHSSDISDSKPDMKPDTIGHATGQPTGHGPDVHGPDMTGHPGQPDTDGSEQMSEAEALAVLNVTQRRPKWLLSQVHPDKHPGFEAEATMATARVNQAMDVRSRNVTEA